MTFSEQFITIMDAVFDKFGIAINWASQNVMPYMVDVSGRIVKYEIATSIGFIVLSLIVLIPLIISTFKGAENREEDDWFIYMTITCVPYVCCIGGIIMQVKDIIQATFLPEMVIIEFLSQFI